MRTSRHQIKVEMLKNEHHYIICGVSAFSYPFRSHANHSIQAVIIKTSWGSAAEKVRKNRYRTTKYERGGVMNLNFVLAVQLVVFLAIALGLFFRRRSSD